MQASHLLWIIAAAALAVLATAFAFQHLGGLAPCPLCIWQRWPYVIGAGLAMLAAASTGDTRWPLAFLAGMVFAGGAGLSGWHAGIEYGWWAGLDACSGTLDPSRMTAEELVDALLATPAVRCDEPAWTLAGISLAGWSFFFLLGVSAITLHTARALRVARAAQGSSSVSQ